MSRRKRQVAGGSYEPWSIGYVHHLVSLLMNDMYILVHIHTVSFLGHFTLVLSWFLDLRFCESKQDEKWQWCLAETSKTQTQKTSKERWVAPLEV